MQIRPFHNYSTSRRFPPCWHQRPRRIETHPKVAPCLKITMWRIIKTGEILWLAKIVLWEGVVIPNCAPMNYWRKRIAYPTARRTSGIAVGRRPSRKRWSWGLHVSPISCRKESCRSFTSDCHAIKLARPKRHEKYESCHFGRAQTWDRYLYNKLKLDHVSKTPRRLSRGGKEVDKHRLIFNFKRKPSTAIFAVHEFVALANSSVMIEK